MQSLFMKILNLKNFGFDIIVSCINKRHEISLHLMNKVQCEDTVQHNFGFYFSLDFLGLAFCVANKNLSPVSSLLGTL